MVDGVGRPAHGRERRIDPRRRGVDPRHAGFRILPVAPGILRVGRGQALGDRGEPELGVLRVEPGMRVDRLRTGRDQRRLRRLGVLAGLLVRAVRVLLAGMLLAGMRLTGVLLASVLPVGVLSLGVLPVGGRRAMPVLRFRVRVRRPMGVAVLAELEEPCARHLEQHQRTGLGGERLPRLGEPGRQRRADPDEQLGVLERRGIRRAQRVAVRAGAAGRDQTGRSHPLHDLGNERCHGRNVGDHARRRGRGRGKERQGNDQRSHGGAPLKIAELRCRRYTITSQGGVACPPISRSAFPSTTMPPAAPTRSPRPRRSARGAACGSRPCAGGRSNFCSRAMRRLAPTTCWRGSRPRGSAPRRRSPIGRWPFWWRTGSRTASNG